MKRFNPIGVAAQDAAITQKLIYRLKLYLHCRKSMRGNLSSITDIRKE
jgi:hypothetical protein